MHACTVCHCVHVFMRLPMSVGTLSVAFSAEAEQTEDVDCVHCLHESAARSLA